ncbi:MAG: hypothetical protein HAW61_05920, partial [Candidatus Portiera sp.]|nr:hypothetical protein [Portiera sp.]
TLDTWWYAGGLVGYARNSKIFNSFALANDGFFGVGMFGGLVGYLDNSVIDSPIDIPNTQGEITGYDQNIGGLVGYSYNSRIISVINNATVNLFNNKNDDVYPHSPSNGKLQNIGGIVGTQNGGEIIATVNMADIFVMSQNSPNEEGINYGIRENLGGLVGRVMDGQLLASYNLGSIRHDEGPKVVSTTFFSGYNVGVSNLDNLGGIVGLMEGGEVKSTYTAGRHVVGVSSRDNSLDALDNSGTLVGNMTGGVFSASYSLGLLQLNTGFKPSGSVAAPIMSNHTQLIGVNSGGNFTANRFDEPDNALANCQVDSRSVELDGGQGGGNVQSCTFNGTQWGDTDAIINPSPESLTFYDSNYWGDSTFVDADDNTLIINYGWIFDAVGELPVLFARGPRDEELIVNATQQRSILSPLSP